MNHMSLLILAALGVCQPASGQVLSAEQLDFISGNFVSLQVDENYRNGNWKPVLEAIGDKRLVLLGEFTHGSKELAVTRNALIRQLHRTRGFDLILFESGLGEMEVLNLERHDLSPGELTTGFFGAWRTSEFRELMAYLKQEDVQFSGFDVQRSGRRFTDYLSGTLVDATAFTEAENAFGALRTELADPGTRHDAVEARTLRLIAAYGAIKDQLGQPDGFSERALDNRIRFLTYMLDFVKTKDWNRRWEARDMEMANNIRWILDKYPPGRKAIVIGHNFHVSRSNDKAAVMAEFLQEEFEGEMFVIGSFAGEGAFSNNAGEPEKLSPADESGLDIKHVISSDGARMTFLDMPESVQNGSEWLQEPITVNDTFVDLHGSDKMVLMKSFDGLLLLDKSTPPEKHAEP